MAEPIKFFATLAGTHTAARWLSVGVEGDAKIVLEADSQQLETILRLARLSGKLLRITVEAEE